ncbi:MAG: hypothetical protein ACW97A_03900 [Candidatus Thorarchaeota archaeon]|jgi:hypothetical protein
MHELSEFLTKVLESKRELKEVYYTTRNGDTKADAKELVVVTITLQKTAEDLLELKRKFKMATKVLTDRKAKLNLRKWKTGLPKRVKDYHKKNGKLSQEHLHRFQESLLEYIESISVELNNWVIDIETLRELPKVPKA